MYRFCREHYTAQIKEETSNNSLTEIIVEEIDAVMWLGMLKTQSEQQGVKLCLKLWFIIADIVKNLINILSFCLGEPLSSTQERLYREN